MKLEKLLSIREANRKFIEDQLQKIEGETETSAKFRLILETVTSKFENLDSLNEKILEQTETSKVEDEIIQTEEYSLTIKIRLQELRQVSENLSTHNPAGNERNNSSSLSEQQTNPIIVQGKTTSASAYTRLPKLSVPTFDGNILEWQAFWDSFTSAVHLNESLTDAQRFNYLRSQLHGDAARKIDGFALTNANYAKAVDLLREQYGQKHKIVHAYIQTLLQLPPPSNTLSGLRHYYDKQETYIRGLESLNQNEDSFGTILVPVIFDKLPPEIRKSLAREHKGRQLQLRELRQAIYEEINILEAGQINNTLCSYETPSTMSLLNGSDSRSRPRQEKEKNTETSQQNGKQQHRYTENIKVCVFCSSPTHLANDCKVIIDYESRIAVVKKKRLCFNCLGNHQIANCKSHKRCKKCQKRHHTSICQSFQIPSQAFPIHLTSINQSHQTAALHTYDHITFEQSPVMQQTPHVLLKTATCPVTSGITTIDTNILFDEGSQRPFITREHADKLQLTTTGTDTLQLASFGSTQNEVRHLNTATVCINTLSGEKIPINVLIVPTIAVPLQKYNNRVANLKHLKGLRLADVVTADTTFEVELLIGADYYWKIVGDKIIRGSGPTAVSSKIGYLLSGPVPFYPSQNGHSTSNLTLNVITQLPQDIDLEKFWKLESLGINQCDDEIPEKGEMRQYQETSIDYNGDKYVAKLPWKLDHQTLPTNYDIVKRRTQVLVNRLRQDPVTLKHYAGIIDDQEKRGFIEKVTEKDNSRENVHYIPHHAVKKESSTTPIRIVYDCSCRMSKDQPSLNDCLQSTPPELKNITDILVRFRLGKYAVVTDIEKAFLHVGLHENDRDMTRFLWLSDPTNPDSELRTYRFKSVLFGAVCSPFILNATLLKHLERNSDLWVSDKLKNDLYVDNFLSSFDQESDVVKYFDQSREIMLEAGFKLRSWNSNSQQLKNKAKHLSIHDKDDMTKVLGMRWDPDTDVMTYPDRQIETKLPNATKRSILQSISKIYDPLGFLTPVTVKAKILLQDIWKSKLDWNTILPKSYQQRWTHIAEDMNAAMKIPIQRYYFNKTDDNRCETDVLRLHIFVDASSKSYGATAYICRGSQSALVMAKNRVSPVKTLTLPKLELMAAMIGARLSQHLRKAQGVEKIDFWSDSQIVLHWLNKPEKANRFTQRRVEEIRNLAGTGKWHYCPTECNPADLLTRGISSSQFKNNILWFTGPRWLTDETKWPTSLGSHCTTVLSTLQREMETEGDQFTNNSQQPTKTSPNLIDVIRFNNLNKLLRVTALTC